MVIAHKLQQLVAAPAPVIAPTVTTITQLIEPPHPYKRVVAGIVMTGRDDTGQLYHEIIVPSSNTARIQEVQKLIFHSIAEEVEKRHYDQFADSHPALI